MSFLKFKISTKIIVVISFLAAVFLSITLLYLMGGVKSIFSDYVLQNSRKEVEVGSFELDAIFDNIQNDTLAISKMPPFQGMFRAEKNNGRDAKTNLTSEVWKDNLAKIFVSDAEAKKIYYQMRYIDENGNEVVRVDYDGQSAKRIPEDKLQNKKDRFYFQEASILPEGVFYVSKPTLNKEGNPPQIEIPYKPVIRYAVPLFNEAGERKGIFIINVYFEKILDKINIKGSGFDNTFLIDQDGNYILHNDKSKEWGGEEDLKTGQNFKKDYPQIAAKVLAGEEGIDFDGQSIYFYKKSLLSRDNNSIFLLLFKDTSRSLVFAPFNKLFFQVGIIGVLVYFLLFFLFFFFISRLLKPLQKLSVVAEKIGQGDFSERISLGTNDEIGKVAATLDNTTEKLQELYQGLEKKVKERTREIERGRHELEKISERLKLATESADIGIWDWDVVHDVLIWDSQMYKLYGIKKEDFSGAYEAWQKGVHPEDKKAGDQSIKEALAGKKEFNTSFRVVWPDKSIHYIRAFALVKRDSKGKPLRMIGVNWDITREKEIDKAKNEFVSLASHQLRTPLTSINWQTGFLLEGTLGKVNKKVKEYLEDIHKSNLRMIELVNALLNVSRIDLGVFAIEAKKISLTEIADSIAEELKNKIKEKKLLLRKEYFNKKINILADPNLTRIILQNFLSNAVKYTPARGKIILKIYKTKQEIVISVRDSGIGIPKNEQSKIYSKLFRGDLVQQSGIEGTGLGLYIVKAIANESGGKTWFESEENKGSTFYFSIPLSGMKKKEGSKGLT